jgi:carbon monoxide dehydrogenase subunit G
MEMSGEYRIPASREKVWAALNDPEVLKSVIPGCQSLEKTSDTTMTATVVSKVGPVKATFKGDVTLSNIRPPEGYTISGEGKGGVAGFAKGGADVTLTEDGSDTILRYEAKAQVGGKLAQVISDPVVTADAIEEDIEAAAGRGFLGGPYMWGLIALIIVILLLIVVR